MKLSTVFLVSLAAGSLAAPVPDTTSVVTNTNVVADTTSVVTDTNLEKRWWKPQSAWEWRWYIYNTLKHRPKRWGIDYYD